MTSAVPPDVARALRRYGIALGAGGEAWAVLAAATEARGLRHRVEAAVLASSRGHAPAQFRALVWRAGEAYPSSFSARGRGATDEEALARALLRMLDRETPEPQPGGAVG